MTIENLSNLLLHYGTILTDDIFDNDSSIRIRTFKYNNRIFYHYMKNGNVVKCFELN